MKNLLILYKYSVFGGVASVIKQRMRLLRKEDWNVHCLFEIDCGGNGGYLKEGVSEIHNLSKKNDFNLMEELLKRNHFSCINIFDWPEAVCAVRKIDKIIPIIYEVHTPLEKSLELNTKETFENTNITIVPSQWSVKFIRSSFPSVELVKIQVVPNIVDETLFYDEVHTSELVKSCRGSQIVWIGKFNDYKNWHEAHYISREVLKKKTDSRLIWITGGDYHINDLDLFWSGYANDDTIERVSWLHNLDHAKIGDILRTASISGGVLLSSSLSESFCLVVHEAIRCGLPVVSTKVGAIPEVLEDGKTGFLYENGDTHQAIDKIYRIIENVELRKDIIHNAIQHIKQFDRSFIENKLKKILRNITGGFPVYYSIPPMQRQRLKPCIAAIMDEFTSACFSPEAAISHITPENWKMVLHQSNLDFVFIESAWRGYQNLFHDVMNDPAKNEIIINIIHYAKKIGLPTVFWNKEDPTNFERFISVARICDFIFTTDENCIQRYREICKHNQVFLLPFAMQPMIHNPIGKHELDGFDIIFGGTWYHRFPERNAHLTELIEASKRYQLFIYERTSINRYDKNYKNLYEWPVCYHPFLKSALPYHELLSAYRHFKVALNVSTVTDSPTMCARRLFELLGCGIPVLSNPAIANDNLLPGLINIASNREEARKCLNILMTDPGIRAKQGHEGWRYAMEHHTYQHRMKFICDTIGKPNIAEFPEKPPVLIISFHQDEKITTEINNMNWPEKRIVWISEEEADNFRHIEKILSTCQKDEYIVFLLWKKCHYDKIILYDLLTAFRYSSADILVKISGDDSENKSWDKITSGNFKIFALKSAKMMDIAHAISSNGLDVSKVRNEKVFSVDPFGFNND